jgi:hypothetical protein
MKFRIPAWVVIYVLAELVAIVGFVTVMIRKG